MATLRALRFASGALVVWLAAIPAHAQSGRAGAPLQILPPVARGADAATETPAPRTPNRATSKRTTAKAASKSARPESKAKAAARTARKAATATAAEPATKKSRTATKTAAKREHTATRTRRIAAKAERQVRAATRRAALPSVMRPEQGDDQVLGYAPQESGTTDRVRRASPKTAVRPAPSVEAREPEQKSDMPIASPATSAGDDDTIVIAEADQVNELDRLADAAPPSQEAMPADQGPPPAFPPYLYPLLGLFGGGLLAAWLARVFFTRVVGRRVIVSQAE